MAADTMTRTNHTIRRKQATRRGRSRAGFTLIELMVALVAGLIAISSVYYISAASSKHFH